MKKQSIIIAALIIAGLASCDRKSYNCRCIGGIGGINTVTEIKARSHESAKKKCEANNPPKGETWPDALHCELE